MAGMKHETGSSDAHEGTSRDLDKPPRKRRQRRRTPPGTSPGTLISDPEAPPPQILVTAYGPEAMIEERITDVAAVRKLRGKWPVVWVDVIGLGDIETIARLGEIFSLHKLALEDVVNVHQRAKLEQYPGCLFMVARTMKLDETLETEQLSVFLGEDFVLTFQERSGDCFDPVRARIRGGRGRMRVGGSGYLAYALLDAVVDRYFPLLEAFGERLEALEDEVITDPGQQTISRIHAVKRDLITLRRGIWPLREVFNTLLREATPYFQAEDRVFLQDCYDHAVQVIDLTENYRELGSGLMDVYLSSVSNRMNEVMKVLTMFASIFIPLSFIAGLYGMNFNTQRSHWNMPELDWPWGYFFALSLMAAVGGGMLIYFRRRGWIGGRRPRAGPSSGERTTPRC